jgi:MFS-type transporter involved in bile tolerance (Atg22 family)
MVARNADASAAVSVTTLLPPYLSMQLSKNTIDKVHQSYLAMGWLVCTVLTYLLAMVAPPSMMLAPP